MINGLQYFLVLFFSSFNVWIFVIMCGFLQKLSPWILAPFPPPQPPPANQQYQLYLSFFEGKAVQLPVVSY